MPIIDILYLRESWSKSTQGKLVVLVHLSGHTLLWTGLARMLWRESQSRKKARSFSVDCKWSRNGTQLRFLFPWPQWNPFSSLHSCGFTYKMGVMLSQCDVTPSYLTDVLWGLMKLCLQCFQFLEKKKTKQTIYGRFKYYILYEWSQFLLCCYTGVLFLLSL